MAVRRPLIVVLACVLGGAAILVAGFGVHLRLKHAKEARVAAAVSALDRLQPPGGMSLASDSSGCARSRGQICLTTGDEPEEAAQALVPVLSNAETASVSCLLDRPGLPDQCDVHGWYAGEPVVAHCFPHLQPRGSRPLFLGTDIALFLVGI